MLTHEITVTTEYGELDKVPARFAVEDGLIVFSGFYIGSEWFDVYRFEGLVGKAEAKRQRDLWEAWWAQDGFREWEADVVARAADYARGWAAE